MRGFTAKVLVALSVVSGIAGGAALAGPAQAAAAWNCTAGYSCYYDGFNGQTKLFTAGRCGEHDLRGGIYQNRINSVANYGSGTVWLDIWRNAGYWEEYARVPVGQTRDIGSNDIDRIVIAC